jgi:hypothetical protein
MALKKSIASYLKVYEVDILNNDGSFSHKEVRREVVPQVDVDMHPLEETAIRAHWNIHDVKKNMPDEISQKMEHDWLIEHGAEHVKQKRAEYATASAVIQPSVDAAQRAASAARDAWSQHAELCLANGHNPDTFVGDARQTLKMPVKES